MQRYHILGLDRICDQQRQGQWSLRKWHDYECKQAEAFSHCPELMLFTPFVLPLTQRERRSLRGKKLLIFTQFVAQQVERRVLFEYNSHIFIYCIPVVYLHIRISE